GQRRDAAHPRQAPRLQVGEPDRHCRWCLPQDPLAGLCSRCYIPRTMARGRSQRLQVALVCAAVAIAFQAFYFWAVIRFPEMAKPDDREVEVTWIETPVPSADVQLPEALSPPTPEATVKPLPIPPPPAMPKPELPKPPELAKVKPPEPPKPPE